MDVEHNGVAERKNKTIMEAVKSMIHDKYLRLHLRDEETRTIMYVQDIISHSDLGNKTLE